MLKYINVKKLVTLFVIKNDNTFLVGMSIKNHDFIIDVNKVKSKLNNALTYLDLRPVYCMVESRDCDMQWGRGVFMVLNKRELIKVINDTRKNSEGPCYFTKITSDEYKKITNHSLFDRFLTGE